MLRCCLFLLLSSLSIAATAQQNQRGAAVANTAPDKPAEGNTYAVIIGVKSYKYLPKLNFTDKDALALKDYLIGFQQADTEKIFAFINDTASSVEYISACESILKSVKKGDRFIFYYSGHGDWDAELNDDAALLLSGAPQKDYLRSGNQIILFNKIKEISRLIAAKDVENIFIVDACHSGKLSGGDTGRTALEEQNALMEHTVKLMACQPKESSYEDVEWGGGRGVFSYYLTQGLRGACIPNPVKDKPYKITVDMLGSYIKNNVRTATDEKQNPKIEGEETKVIAIINSFDSNSFSQPATGNHAQSNHLIAQKGLNNNADTTYTALLKKFDSLLSAKIIATPDTECAIKVYNKLTAHKAPPRIILSAGARIQSTVMEDFDAFISRYYDDQDYTADTLKGLLKEVQACMQLTDSQSLLYNEFYARQLFLETCLNLYDYDHSPQKSDDNNENKRRRQSTGQEATNGNKRTDNRLRPAIDSLEKAVKITSLEPFLHKRLGDLYLDNGDDYSALENCNLYIKMLPNDAHSYYARGMEHYAMGRLGTAIDDLRKAVKLDPKYKVAYYQLSILYRENDQKDKAKDALEKAKKLDK